MDLETAKQSLCQRGWLSRVPKDFSKRLLENARLRRVEPEEALCHMADPSADMFGCADGLVSVFLDAGPSAARLAFVAHPGYWGGTIGTADGVPRRASLFARTPVTTLSVSLSHVEAMAREDGDTWRYVCMNAASHFDNLALLLLANVHQNNDVRVMITLRRLYDFNDGERNFPVSQSEIAEMAGLSRNSVNRSIGRLVAQGLIEAGYGWLRITDPDGIKAALNRAHLPFWTSKDAKQA
ncbi:transcriptional regulator, Crp/Fnr family [Rhodovulum sp. P5]|nr:transcriptional regulator, Crp/Fnr family [Rhodovulum sp. P5]